MGGPRGTEPDLTLRYADHACGELDVHLPPADPGSPRTSDDLGSPRRSRSDRLEGSTVLLVHGGFWKAAIDRTHTRPQARALADLGHVVVTPEYRRVGSRLLHPRAAGGGWPTTGDDVRAALDALPRLLPEAGVEPGPVTAVGHSAGGHLVLWLAATGAPLVHVAALAPVCDLRESVRRDLGGGAAQALLDGQDPSVADPMTLLDDRPTCSVSVLHGRADGAVPVELSRGLVQRHPWIAYDEIDADHMSLIDPTSSAWPHTVAAVGGGIPA